MANKPRQTILKPVGLVTQPNEFGYYVDGALQIARNCVMRNPGELDAAPSMFSSLSCGAVNGTLAALMPLDSGHVYELTYTAGGVFTVTELGNAASIPGGIGGFSTTGLFSTTGRISPVRAKDRMLLNSNQGYLVGDNMAPANAGQRALRQAGLPQVQLVVNNTNAGGPIGASTNVLYSAIITRTYSDGYKLASVPSPLLVIGTTVGGPWTFQLAARWAQGSTNATIRAGDVLELYRSDGISNVTNILVTPPPVLKLVKSITLTATDISNAQIAPLFDTAAIDAAPLYTTTGRELYTNPFFGGSVVGNRQPPIAKCTATFDGRTFYANTTDRPKFTFAIPGGVGDSAQPTLQTTYFRTNGIGNKNGTGTITNGSPTITAVPANLFAGLQVGMYWNGNTPPFNPATDFIIALNSGAGTITMSANATAGAALWNFADVLEVSVAGLFPQTLLFRFSSYATLIQGLFGTAINLNTVPLFEVTANQPLPAYTINTIYQTGVSVTIEPSSPSLSTTLNVRATNGANYMPPVAELYGSPTTYPTQPTATLFSQTTLKNRVTWSKDQQPEHVPPGGPINETFVGLREIIAMASTKDALWFACLDGLFRLSGIGGQYRLDQIDSTKIICGPKSMAVLNEDVYIYTNFGMIVVSGESRDNITDMIIGDLLTGPEYLETASRILIANEGDLEIMFLDDASANRIYVYMTKENGGWTTLENNGAALSNITTMVYQRSPTLSFSPQPLIGVSPLGGVAASYASWGNPASYLTMDFRYQPVYADDPMGLKQWIEASFLFNSGNTGKTLQPNWNGVSVGSAAVVQYQNAAYARAGVPRVHAISSAIAPGANSITPTGVQPRFLGVSLMFKPLTTQAKQRT